MEGVEGTVGVLGVLDAVEVVHVVAPDNEEEHPSEELQGVCHTAKVPHGRSCSKTHGEMKPVLRVEKFRTRHWP